MRTLVCLLLLFACVSSSFSQDTSNRTPQTKIEQMAQRQGVVIKKEFNRLGEVSGLAIDLLTISEVNSNQAVSLKGVKFSTYSSIGSSSYERSSYVDAEEINGVITFIEFARQLTTAPNIYTEYVYTTKGDFKAVLYTGSSMWNGKLNGEWTLAVYGDKYYSGSSRAISKKQIDDFWNILIRARDLLK
jgi:hypothetical protein